MQMPFQQQHIYEVAERLSGKGFVRVRLKAWGLTNAPTSTLEALEQTCKDDGNASVASVQEIEQHRKNTVTVT